MVSITVGVGGLTSGVKKVIVWLIKINNGTTIMPGKSKVMMILAAMPKGVDTFDVILGKEELHPMVLDEPMTGHQAHEIVSALAIASWA